MHETSGGCAKPCRIWLFGERREILHNVRYFQARNFSTKSSRSLPHKSSSQTTNDDAPNTARATPPSVAAAGYRGLVQVKS